MIKMLLMKLIKNLLTPAKPRHVEDIMYSKTTYPLYICTQQAFNFCIKNRLMKRDDILEFKRLLNSFIVNTQYYKNIKFKNDVHEIYKKLKNHYIKPKEMQKLLDFVNQFVIAIPEPLQTVKHLRVIK